MPCFCLICIAAGSGAVALVVSFTASCRAYRRCGLKAIASLYGFVFLCNFFCFAQLALYIYWRGCNLYWCPECIRIIILVAVSGALWLVCFVLALSVPPFDTCNPSRSNEETTTHSPRGGSVYSNPQNNQGDEEDAYIRVKTVTAVPIPLPGLEEPPSHNNARLRKDAGQLGP